MMVFAGIGKKPHVGFGPKKSLQVPFLAGIYGVDIICIVCHILSVSWVVEIGDEFEPEFDALHEDVRTEILVMTRLL